jgi:hypothetical protein
VQQENRRRVFSVGLTVGDRKSTMWIARLQGRYLQDDLSEKEQLKWNRQRCYAKIQRGLAQMEGSGINPQFANATFGPPRVASSAATLLPLAETGSRLADSIACFFDQLHYVIGVSRYGSVTRLQRNRLFRVDSLRHPLFSLRRNQAVIGRDLIPTGLHFPCRRSRPLFETTCRCWLLAETPN